MTDHDLALIGAGLGLLGAIAAILTAAATFCGLALSVIIGGFKLMALSRNMVMEDDLRRVSTDLHDRITTSKVESKEGDRSLKDEVHMLREDMGEVKLSLGRIEGEMLMRGKKKDR